MRPEEEVARKFLEVRFGIDPTYEPLGDSTPPDFCINRTAFEIRRLNQHYVHEDGTPEALEQIEYRLHGAVHGELNKIPFSTEKGSYFWGLDFERPLLDEPGKIARKLASRSRSHYSAGVRERKVIVAGSVRLELMPSGDVHGKAFEWGYRADGDSGGFIGGIYSTNVRLALEDKISKTKRVAERFERWVLVLVDSILPDIMKPSDIGELNLDLQHFNSIAIINPNGSFVTEFPVNSLNGLEP